jgi:fibronectin-binding autotransporter adhesin
MKSSRSNRFLSVLLVATSFVSSLCVSQAANFYWDGGTADFLTDGDGASDGGSGDWNTTLLNWDNGASPHIAWPSSGTDNDAIFSGLVGTVTLTSGVTANDLTFNTSGYIIQGSNLTLNGDGVTAPTITTNAGTATISSIISGSNGLKTAGTGTLILTGANNYSGGTNISSGSTLQIGTGGVLGSGNIVNNGNLVFNQAAAITVPASTLSGTGNLSVTSTNNSITVSNALTQDGNITLNAFTNTTVSANITAGGALSIQPGNGDNSGLALGNVTLTAASINLGVTGIGNSGTFGTGTLTLNTSAANGSISIGGDIGRNGNVSPNPQNGLFGSLVVNAGAGTITLAANKTTAYLGNLSNTFTGAVVLANNVIFSPKDSNYNGGNTTGGTASFNGTVDLGTKTMQGATGTNDPWGLFTAARALTFNGSSISNGTLGTGTANLIFNTATSQTVSANITNGTIASGSAGTVTKSGVGTTILSGNNTYTGMTTISGGTLQLDSTTALKVANAVTFAGNSTTLLINAPGDMSIGALTVNSGLTGANISFTQNSATRSHTIAGATLGSALTINQSNSSFPNWNQVSWSSKITGTGGGSGNDTLVFNNTSSMQNYFTTNSGVTHDFSGNVHLKAGVIAVQNGTPGGNQTIPDASMLWIEAGEWRWNTGNVTETIDGLRGGGTFGNSGNVLLTITANNSANNANRTFSGTMGNLRGTLTMNGTGTQTFSGTGVTYNNGTALSNGALTLRDTTSFASAITLSSNGVLNSERTALGFDNRENILGGISSGTGTININNSGTGVAGGWTTIAVANGLTMAGAININSGVLTRDNTTADNINTTATINVDANGVLGTRGGAVTIGALNGAGKVSPLWSNASSTTLTLGNGNGSGSFSGIIHGNGSSAVDGNIEGGTLALTKIGNGTQILSGANTYTGATTITTGTLEVNGSLASGSTVGIGTAGTLSGIGTINGNTTLTGAGVINKSSGTLAGTLGVTGGNWNGAGSVTGVVTSSSGTFTIGTGANLTANSGLNVTGGTIVSGDISSTITGSVNYTSGVNSTFGGIIAGSGKTLTMNNGSATLTLNGANSYTGTTAVQAGTLALGLNGTISNTLVLGASGGGTGTLDVTAKTAPFDLANVSGSGTINIGSGKTINVSTALAPGFSPGALNFDGNLTLANGSITTMELGAISDEVNVTGTLTVDGTLNILAYDGFDITQLATYSLFEAGFITGNFDAMSLNDGVNVHNFTFSNDVWSTSFGDETYNFSPTSGVLAVVPEPAAALLGSLGMLALLRRRRA